jgi:hypothetical protein
MKKSRKLSILAIIIILLTSCGILPDSAESGTSDKSMGSAVSAISLDSLMLGSGELSCTVPAMLKNSPLIELPDGTFVIERSFRINASGEILNSYDCSIIAIHDGVLIAVKIEEQRKGISILSLDFDSSNQGEIAFIETKETPKWMGIFPFTSAAIYGNYMFLGFKEERTLDVEEGFSAGLATQEVFYRISLADGETLRLNQPDHYSNDLLKDSGALLTLNAPVVFGSRIYAAAYENHEKEENRIMQRGSKVICSTDLSGNGLNTEIDNIHADVSIINITEENGDVIIYALAYSGWEQVFDIIRINLTTKEHESLVTYSQSNWVIEYGGSMPHGPRVDIGGGVPSWSEGYIYFIAPYVSDEFGVHSVFKIDTQSGNAELVKEFGEDMHEYANSVFAYNGYVLITSLSDYGDGVIVNRYLIDKDGVSVQISPI